MSVYWRDKDESWGGLGKGSRRIREWELCLLGPK